VFHNWDYAIARFASYMAVVQGNGIIA
jgi:hypothetical protein